MQIAGDDSSVRLQAGETNTALAQQSKRLCRTVTAPLHESAPATLPRIWEVLRKEVMLAPLHAVLVLRVFLCCSAWTSTNGWRRVWSKGNIR